MKLNNDISKMRKEYGSAPLSKELLHEDPMIQFRDWFDQAVQSELLEPNAMTLATTNHEGQPSARIVLLKELEEDGFVFYTNYNSRKGKEILTNPKVALVFAWIELHRQVRIEGTIHKVSAIQSDTYFNKRPINSRLGAIVSEQSDVIPDRTTLETKLKSLQDEVERGVSVQRPAHWGGYKVVPNYIEFWQGRRSRLHDRFSYRLTEDAWEVIRLSP